MTLEKPPLSPKLARAELARRELARRHLIDFIEYTFPGYEAAPHHKLIADHLEAVERGELDRLMITMPPRHGKSELASRRFPAWFLGRQPNRGIIAASYNSDLATDFGREVRAIVNSQEYGAIFKTSLSQDSRAANRWNTAQGGTHIAAGVGTAVTGRGADVLLIDDPLKDRDEADSEVKRQRIWDWYTSTAYTRLAPGGRVVVIQTRWSEDDLSGRLLDAMESGGDDWTVLSLPAISEQGEPLWPERYPIKALERIRANIGNRDWSALYQQEPAPEEGLYFKREWMRHYRPMQFGPGFWVCPGWMEPPDPGAVNLLLDPGLAFGTGTHPTTALCLTALAGMSLADATVVDYGCGSGILAVAAARLGARHVLAVDNDPQALRATLDNADRNSLPPGRIQAVPPGDAAIGAFSGRGDLVVANILAGPLTALRDTLCDLLRPGGTLLLSGIIRSQATELIQHYAPRIALTGQGEREDWVCLAGRSVPGPG